MAPRADRLGLRRTANIRFVRKHTDFMNYVGDDKLYSVITIKYEDLTEAWRYLEQSHDAYMSYVDDCDIATAEELMTEAQCMYNAAMEKYHDCRAVREHAFSERISERSGMVKLEKTRLPIFSGNMRDYPRFKSDYQKYVEPNIPTSMTAYTLRTCLSKDAAHRVRNTDEITEMWTLLDEKYADAATIADIILDDISRTKNLKDGDDKRFIDFVDRIEDGYYDLCTLGLQREITTTSSVSIIEEKLSPSVKTNWARLVSMNKSKVDKSDKFPSLLEFLKVEKRSLEYRGAALRSRVGENQNHVSQSTLCDHRIDREVRAHHIDLSRVERIVERSDTAAPSATANTCLIHQDSSHGTETCNMYESKSVQDRYQLLKQKGACWLCLKVGHRRHECRSKKRCGVSGCKRRHHKSLHFCSGNDSDGVHVAERETQSVTGERDDYRNQMKNCASQRPEVHSGEDVQRWTIVERNRDSVTFPQEMSCDQNLTNDNLRPPNRITSPMYNDVDTMRRTDNYRNRDTYAMSMTQW